MTTESGKQVVLFYITLLRRLGQSVLSLAQLALKYWHNKNKKISIIKNLV